MKSINIHWTENENWALDREYDYGINDPRSLNAAAVMVSQKPVGLWYDFNGDWANHPCSGECLYGYEVEIERRGDLLLLRGTRNGLDEIYAFRDKYATSMIPQGYPENLRELFKVINWRKVREDYGGIEIYPYVKFIYDRNLISLCDNWYSSWDVASGCIWDLSLVQVKGRLR